MTKKRLVLFDIDGTILTTNGIAKEYFIRAMERSFEYEGITRDHDFSGKLDTQIYRELIETTSINPSDALARREHFFKAFYEDLKPQLTNDKIKVCPGIPQLVRTLHENPNCTIGLLTGNMPLGAELKLNAVGLWHYFPFGAFGSDGNLRPELPAVALRKAGEVSGIEYSGAETVIIGDTPNDITCGIEIGAKSLAVATGRYSYAQLESHNPDHLFESLENTEDVLEAIFS